MASHEDQGAYTLTFRLYGKKRQIQAWGFWSFMLLSFVVNVLVLLPFPLSAVPRFGLYVYDSTSQVFAFARAMFIMFTTPPPKRSKAPATSPASAPTCSFTTGQRAMSPSGGRRRYEIPPMHILAGTFGKTLYNERKRSNPPSRVHSSTMLAAYNDDSSGSQDEGSVSGRLAPMANSSRHTTKPAATLAYVSSGKWSSGRVATPPEILTPQLSPTMESPAEGKFVEFGTAAVTATADDDDKVLGLSAAARHAGKHRAGDTHHCTMQQPTAAAQSPGRCTGRGGSTGATGAMARLNYAQKLY